MQVSKGVLRPEGANATEGANMTLQPDANTHILDALSAVIRSQSLLLLEQRRQLDQYAVEREWLYRRIEEYEELEAILPESLTVLPESLEEVLPINEEYAGVAWLD